MFIRNLKRFGRLHCDEILPGNIIVMASIKYSGTGTQIGQLIYQGHVLISDVTADSNEKGQLVLRLTQAQSKELMEKYEKVKNSSGLSSHIAISR